MGTLFLVATPIGNLDDITIRALRILREAPLVAAEDTRTTRHLFARHEIGTRMVSFHKLNQRTRTPQLLAHLASADLALVTDAGTPGVADPGVELVSAALAMGIHVIPIPGASAPITALVGSGLPTDGFLFIGFLPRLRGNRRRLLLTHAGQRHTLVAFEAPHRLRATLKDIQFVLGNRQIVVAREMTKIHEEWVRGDVHHAIARFTDIAPRGEITLVIAGKPAADSAVGKHDNPDGIPGLHEQMTDDELVRILRDLMNQGRRPRQAAAELSKQTGRSPRSLYGLLIAQNPSASI